MNARVFSFALATLSSLAACSGSSDDQGPATTCVSEDIPSRSAIGVPVYSGSGAFDTFVARNRAGDIGFLYQVGATDLFYFYSASLGAWSSFDVMSGAGVGINGFGDRSPLIVDADGNFIFAYLEQSASQYTLYVRRYVPSIGMSSAIPVMAAATDMPTATPSSLLSLNDDQVGIGFTVYSSGLGRANYSVVTFSGGTATAGAEVGDPTIVPRDERDPHLFRDRYGIAITYVNFSDRLVLTRKNGGAWNQLAICGPSSGLGAHAVRAYPGAQTEVTAEIGSTLYRMVMSEAAMDLFSEPVAVMAVPVGVMNPELVVGSQVNQNPANDYPAAVMLGSTREEYGAVVTPSASGDAAWTLGAAARVFDPASVTALLGASFTDGMQYLQTGIDGCGRPMFFVGGGGKFSVRSF